MKIQGHLTTNEDNVDLSQIIKAIWFNKLTILLFTILTAILSFIYAYGMVSTYEANILLQVESTNATIPGFEQLAGLTEETATVGTEIALIKSRKNLGLAVDTLKLDIIAYPNRVSILGRFYKKFFNNEGTSPLPKIWKHFDNFMHKYAWGNERIKVESISIPSSLMDIPLILISKKNDTFDLVTKKENKFILVGKVGVPSASSDGSTTIFVSELKSSPGTEFIVKKQSKSVTISNMKSDIKASEMGKKTGIIYISMQGKDTKVLVDTLDHISQTYLAYNKSRNSEEATNALKFLEEQIKPVKSLMDRAEGNLSKYRTDNKTADLSLETRAVLDIVTEIDTELNKLTLKRDELNQRYTNSHPTIQAIFSQERKLQKRKESTLSKISRLPKKQQKLLKLERDFKVTNTFYNDILNNIQEFKIAEASSVGNVYIIDSAIANRKPVKPKKALLIITGTILGMILGFAVIFMRKVLNNKIDDPEKLEEMIGIPVYATVPLTTGAKKTSWFNSKKKTKKFLLAQEDFNDPAIEGLRSLRTSLHFALHEAKNNIVMITGPSPNVGKSFIASNFAAVAASAGQRVILVDADMRKGYLHDLLELNLDPGLSDIITEKATLEDIIHTVKIGDTSMDVITRGQTPPNPSELLMHAYFKKLLDYLSNHYDLVLVDSPPIHAVTDPTIIGSHAGVVFMVVRSDENSIKEIEHAIKLLSHNGIKTKGFIFNGYVVKNSGYGYGYGYNYYGGYK